jgi:hypothetical protein
MTLPIMVNGEAGDIPAILASKYAHHPAAGYVTGGWPIEWSEKDFGLFARKIRIAQSAQFQVDDDTTARALDVEPGAAGAAMWPGFFQSRRRPEIATAYCSLVEVPAVIEVCKLSGIKLPPRWWPAWWWGERGYPSRGTVLVELHRLTGVELDPESLWGCQFQNDRDWQLSVVYGKPDFDR